MLIVIIVLSILVLASVYVNINLYKKFDKMEEMKNAKAPTPPETVPSTPSPDQKP